ncbi:MAG: hypothetical protein EXR99_13140 [Gemmataceae bacterium]|nr:hypothetical protein [Gemmataceae bacterium]
MDNKILDGILKEIETAIQSRGRTDLYIDRDEEREILQIALQRGMTLDLARKMLSETCQKKSFVVESSVLQQFEDRVFQWQKEQGNISEKAFQALACELFEKTQGAKALGDCKQILVEVIETNDYSIRPGLFSDWFQRVKKELDTG